MGSCSVLQDGISQCHFSAAVSSRLGCDVRSVGWVPACSNPSGIALSSRLIIPGSDLFLQGLTVRAVRLSLGVHQISSSKFLGPPCLLLRFTLEVTQRLDFLIIWKKSFFTPLRFPCYLGARLDIFPRALKTTVFLPFSRLSRS